MTTPLTGITSALPSIGSTTGTTGASATSKTLANGSGFGDVLKAKLEDLNASQVAGQDATKQLATGKVDDIAQTMLRIEEANVSLQLATQIRNKAVEAYQEILRMQV